MSPEVQRKSKIKKLALLNLLIWLLLFLLAVGNSLLIDTGKDSTTVAENEITQDEVVGQATPASPPSETKDKYAFAKRPADSKHLSTKSSDRVYAEPYSESFKDDIRDIGDIEAPEGVQPLDPKAEKAATKDSPVAEAPSGEPSSEEAASTEAKAASDDSDTSAGTGVVVAGGVVSSGGETGGEEPPEEPENEIPQIDSVSISPEPAYKTTTLNAAYTNWQDADGPARNPLYQWYRNGSEIPGATGASLDCSSLDVGDEIYCVITPNDTIGSGKSKRSNYITIDNIPPEIGSVTVSPDPAYRATILVAEYSDWHDPDDPNGTEEPHYQWWRTRDPDFFYYDYPIESATSKYFDCSLLGVGIEVYCYITPYDGYDEGTPVASNHVLIRNVPPEIGSLTISPDPAYRTTTLVAEYSNLQDPDDPEEALLVFYQWWKVGDPEDIRLTMLLLDNNSFNCEDLNVGDEVYCIIMAWDGYDISPATESNHVTIQNIAPNVQLISPDGGEYWNGTRSITWDADDPDDVSEDLLIEIEYQIGEAGWLTVATNEANDGTYTWNTETYQDSAECRVRITASDGIDSATDTSTASFTVDNTPPSVTITSPEEGSICYASSPEVAGEAGDDTSGVESVLIELIISGESQGQHPVTYANGLFNHTLSGLAEGQNTIKATASDKAGNSTSTSVDITHVATTEVFPEESIQDAMDDPESKEIIYLHEGTYDQDVNMKDGKILMGADVHETIIKGHIVFAETTATVKTLTVKFTEAGCFSFTSSNGSYQDWKLLTDAGITAINSEITVENCIIMPDPDVFGENKYGKGIQIWNLYGTLDITPMIGNTEIQNTEDGIFLYSHPFGGAILGEIRQNTIDSNTRGITLRMHKENPLIEGNTISYCTDGIHITYDSLLTERLNNITGNTFSNNTHNIWCDEQ